MRKTIVEHLQEHAKKHPDKVAVIADGVETSYRELYALVVRYASFLKQKNLIGGGYCCCKIQSDPGVRCPVSGDPLGRRSGNVR